MPTVTAPDQSTQLTLNLSPESIQYIRQQVASGGYANASDYIESMLFSETLFDPIPAVELTQWMETEGLRRLEALKANPSSGLSHDDFWAAIESEDNASLESHQAA